MSCINVFYCLINCVGAAVFVSTAIFGVALCVGVAIFIPGDLCSVSFVQLYFHIVHYVCVGFAWFDGRIRLVLVELCFGAGVLPGRLPVWISRSCWAARMANALLFIFVFLLCLCAGQASSAEKVHGQY
jgi:hypothetical protein